MPLSPEGPDQIRVDTLVARSLDRALLLDQNVRAAAGSKGFALLAVRQLILEHKPFRQRMRSAQRRIDRLKSKHWRAVQDVRSRNEPRTFRYVALGLALMAGGVLLWVQGHAAGRIGTGVVVVGLCTIGLAAVSHPFRARRARQRLLQRIDSDPVVTELAHRLNEAVEEATGGFLDTEVLPFLDGLVRPGPQQGGGRLPDPPAANDDLQPIVLPYAVGRFWKWTGESFLIALAAAVVAVVASKLGGDLRKLSIIAALLASLFAIDAVTTVARLMVRGPALIVDGVGMRSPRRLILFHSSDEGDFRIRDISWADISTCWMGPGGCLLAVVRNEAHLRPKESKAVRRVRKTYHRPLVRKAVRMAVKFAASAASATESPASPYIEDVFLELVASATPPPKAPAGASVVTNVEELLISRDDVERLLRL